MWKLLNVMNTLAWRNNECRADFFDEGIRDASSADRCSARDEGLVCTEWKSDVTLVAKVSAVGLLSVEGVQEEAEEDNVVVQMPFSEAKEHLRWRTLQLPKT